jgi:hypothetical protein
MDNFFLYIVLSALSAASPKSAIHPRHLSKSALGDKVD